MTKTAIDLAREVLDLDRREFGLDDSYNDYHRQYENRRNGLVAASSALLSVQERLEKAEELLKSFIEEIPARTSMGDIVDAYAMSDGDIRAAARAFLTEQSQ